MSKDSISGKFLSLDALKPKVLEYINEYNATRCIHVSIKAVSLFPREEIIREFKLKSTPFGDFDDFTVLNEQYIKDNDKVLNLEFRIHYTSIDSAIRAFDYFCLRIEGNGGTIADTPIGQTVYALNVTFGSDRCDRRSNIDAKNAPMASTTTAATTSQFPLHDDDSVFESDLSPIQLKESSSHKATQVRESPPTSASGSISTTTGHGLTKREMSKTTRSKERMEDESDDHEASTTESQPLENNLISNDSNIALLQGNDMPKSFANSDADLDDVDIEDISTPTSNIELESSFSKLLIGRNGRNSSSSSSLSNDPYISRIQNNAHPQAFENPNTFGNSYLPPFQNQFNNSRSRSFSVSSERINNLSYSRSDNSAVAAAAAAAHAAAAQAQAAALAAVAAASSSTSQAQKNELAALASSLNNSANLNYEAIVALAERNNSMNSLESYNGKNRTIYLGKLHPRTTVEEIANNVRAGGLVESIHYVRDHDNCFIKFIDPNVALAFHASHQYLHRLIIHGTEVVVGWARNHSGPVSRSVMTAVANGASRNVYLGVRYKENERLVDNNNDGSTPSNSTSTGSGTVVELPGIDELRYDFMKFGEMEQINYYHNGSCVFLNFLNIADAIRVVKLFDTENEAKLSNDYRHFYNKYKYFKISFGKDRCANPPKFYFKREPQEVVHMENGGLYSKTPKAQKDVYTKVYQNGNAPNRSTNNGKEYMTTFTPCKKKRRGTTSSPTDDFNEDIINEEAAMVFGIIQSDKRREEELAREVERQRLLQEDETTQEDTVKDDKLEGPVDDTSFFDDEYDYSEGIRYVDVLDVEKEMESALEINTIEELDEDKTMEEADKDVEDADEEDDEDEDDDEDDDDDVSIIISSADSSMIQDRPNSNTPSYGSRPSYNHSYSAPNVNGNIPEKKNDYYNNNNNNNTGYQRKSRYSKHGNNKLFRRNYSVNSFDGYHCKTSSRNHSATSLPGNFGIGSVPPSPYMNPQNHMYYVAATNPGLHMGVPSPYMPYGSVFMPPPMNFEWYSNGHGNEDSRNLNGYHQEPGGEDGEDKENGEEGLRTINDGFEANGNGNGHVGTGYPMHPPAYSYGYLPEAYANTPGSQVMMEYLAKVQQQNHSTGEEDDYMSFYLKFANKESDK